MIQSYGCWFDIGCCKNAKVGNHLQGNSIFEFPAFLRLRTFCRYYE